MAAEITFWAGEGSAINALSGSGLGFYGDGGFGASVQVGAWQGRTFITNAAGTAQGPEVDNVKYLNSTGCILGQSGSGILLTQIPNYLASLEVRFNYDTSVKVQNATFRAYDRVSASNPASGVTLAACEVIHTGTTQTADGSGDSTWTIFTPTGNTPMDLVASPGTSGLSPNGSNTTDTQHSWYIALSASPDSIGSKTFGGYCSLEYL